MKTIFVSSTFKDMHYERDAIRDTTAPLLNAEAKKYGDEVDFCDLRWGINTGDLDTEEGSRKVLDVCLDEIDRSEPPMVVLLGYRYGWIPDAGLIRTAADRKHLELEDLERSVTALEIEYGALCDKKKFENTLFYFRKIEGDAPPDYLAEDREHEEKILALKNRIKNITGGNVEEYTLKWNGSGFDGVDDFAERLAEDIKKILMHEWKEMENLSDFQRERRTHSAFIREKNVMFRARQAEAEKLMKDALSQPVTIIKGEVGSGKSTLFCHMATELEKSGWTVLPFISGLTMESNSARDIIENTVYFIEEELCLGHYRDEADSQTYDKGNNEVKAAPLTDKKKGHISDELREELAAALLKLKNKDYTDKWREKLAEMCSAYAKTGAKLLIMVDAADQLAQDKERDNLHFIPTSVSENIHFVMTSTTDFKTPGREHYTLRQLNVEDKLDVINGILTRCGREISRPVIDGMLELDASASPLYLSLLVQRLLMMNREDFADIRSRGDGMTAIEQHQLELIRNKCPDDLDEMSAALLSEAGKRINENLISRAAQYLAVSRNGLRKKDMAALLGGEWTELDFSHFVTYMSDCFLLRDDGRYDFTHKSIRSGFRGRCKDPDGVNREILEYFKSLEADDPVRMGEIIYHTIAADDKKFFVGHVIKHAFDPHIIIHAARDVSAQCITDNGQWIIDVLQEAKKQKADEKLCNLAAFCNNDLYKVLLGEREAKLSILPANLELAEHLYHKLGSTESKKTLSISYKRVARTYAGGIGHDDKKRAIEPYEKALAIKEQLAAELDTRESKRDLSYCYIEVAELYEMLDGCDNLKQAMALHEKALAIRKQLNNDLGIEESNLDINWRIAGNYKKLGGRENLKLALDLYEKSLEIEEQKTEETARSLGIPLSNIHLLLHYIELAKIYEELGGTDNLKRELRLYEKIRAACEQDKQPPSEFRLSATQLKSVLSTSSHKAAEIYEKLGGSDNLKRALELHEKALTIREQLAAETGSAESKRDLSFSYDMVAGTYGRLGGSDNLKRALELSEKSLTIKEQLVAELGTAESIRELFTQYYYVAAIYEKLGGSDNLKQALMLYVKVTRMLEKISGSDSLELTLEIYKNILAISEQLADELGTTQSKWDLSVSYMNVAGILEKLGGSDNLAQALGLYHKVLEIREPLADTLQTPDAYGDLAECLLKTARHPSTSISDKKALLSRGLEISKELYEKTSLDKYRSYIDEYEKLLSGC